MLVHARRQLPSRPSSTNIEELSLKLLRCKFSSSRTHSEHLRQISGGPRWQAADPCLYMHVGSCHPDPLAHIKRTEHTVELVAIMKSSMNISFSNLSDSNFSMLPLTLRCSQEVCGRDERHRTSYRLGCACSHLRDTQVGTTFGRGNVYRHTDAHTRP